MTSTCDLEEPYDRLRFGFLIGEKGARGVMLGEGALLDKGKGF